MSELVMISSTAQDLPAYRKQVSDACLQADLKPKMMEHLSASDADAIEASLDMVNVVDIYVGIFAYRYGYIPEDHDISITQMELERAEERGIPIFLFIMDEEVAILPKDMDMGEPALKLHTLKERLKRERVVGFFKNPEDLRGKVYQSLIEHKEKRQIERASQKAENPPTISTPLPEARRRYLKAFRRDCLQIPLTALGEDINHRKAVTLDQVFVSLNVTEKDHKKLKEADHWLAPDQGTPQSALDAIKQCDQLVLLGDPGSGKSSLVKHVLANIAATEQGKETALLPDTQGLLPVLIVLRDLAPLLAGLDLPTAQNQRRATLANLIVSQAIAYTGTLQTPEFSDGIRQSFVDEQVFLVLDGLDEVPYHLRGLVREAAGAVLNQFDLQHVIITCRIRSYTGDAVFDEVKTYTLAKLDEAQIKSFVINWYNVQCDLGRVKKNIREDRSNDLLEVATRDPLVSLAGNPMLLTTMTIIHQQQARLPDERVKLYKLAVELLLRRWQEENAGLPDALSDFLSSDEKVRPAVERLAFEAHKAGEQDEAADLERTATISLLSEAPYLGHESLATDFLDYVDLRSGLLIGRGGAPNRPAMYSFPHRTFQEYLAGCYIVGARGAAPRLKELAEQGDFWTEAVLLGIQEQVYNSGSYGQNQILNLASQLTRERPRTEVEHRQYLWAGKMAEIVGPELVSQDPGDIESGSALLGRLQSTFVELLAGPMSPIERVEAGRTLAHLGDPRKELLTIEDLQFCYVPAGPFVMGSPEGVGYDDERPQHELDVPAFWMGRTPVTQAQYQFFVDGGGYADKQWWTEAGWDYISNSEQNEPKKYDTPYDLINHPVVGVTWYEALAFTRWLTAHGRTQGWLTAEQQISLPNEPEWEKAARGGVQIPEEPCYSSLQALSKNTKMIDNIGAGRLYPWGDEITRNHCNYDQTEIASTSSPGCFLHGRSPVGCDDMSGNIFEWVLNKSYPPYPNPLTETKWSNEDGDEPRVLRGGSFGYTDFFVRCAYRDGYDPSSRRDYVGFRIVALPLLRTSSGKK